MKNNIKISIIVPVYNTAIYLRKCLTSLCEQTLKQIEIICVNDGSTDNSLDILQEFANNDNRIIIIDQKNMGQSAARNAGMKVASGEFIGFIDSDDWADKEMFEKLYKNSLKFSSDIIMCSISVFDEKTNSFDINDPYMTLKLFPKDYFLRAFSYKDCLDFLFRICVTPWNKIYRKDWLIKNHLQFFENVNFEDVIFAVDSLIKAERISLVNEPLVFYRKESKTSYSTGNKNKDYKKLDFFKVFNAIEETLKKNLLWELLEDYFEFHKRHNLIYWRDKIQDRQVKKKYNKMLFSLYPELKFQWFWDYIKKQKLKSNIKKIAKTQKIIIWGAGDFVRSLLPKNVENILGFVDSNRNLHNKILNSYRVYSIDALTELKPDIILAITKNYYKYGKLVESSLSDYNLSIPVKDLML